jgi:Fe-S cluster assembly iron-binding protein IscA
MNLEYQETLIETKVTYSLEINGQFFLIENVPARVNPETDEQFFSPTTVERIQEIIDQQQKPTHFIKTPVYDFSA